MRREFDSPWPHLKVLNSKKINFKIPEQVSYVTDILEKAGFEAFLVGGCVRDLLIEKPPAGGPKDWDITTNAKPEDIIKLFSKTVYENNFGTVKVFVPYETTEKDVSQETKFFTVEVTPYRLEFNYTDFRHPDKIEFSQNLEDDLKRRDFTINSIALRDKEIKDTFNGIKDIKDKVLRTVGEPDERFKEDPLRMLRAIRFSVQLDFLIAQETSESILKNSFLIKKISQERIRDELIKIIMSANPSAGILLLQKLNLLKYIIPELEEGINCEQSGEHIYDVFNHLLHALQHSANKNYILEVRLAALFHDIGKPKSKRVLIKKNNELSTKKKFTFYGHEVISARLAKSILSRLKFSKKEIILVESFVRNHMFFSDTEIISLSAVRRIIQKVNPENIWFLMQVRECDRIGMKKKEAPYRLRKYFAMIEEALRDPISVKQLKINGEVLKNDLKINPGPRMGWILNALLEEVLENPEKNNLITLLDLAQKLNQLSDQELKIFSDEAKNKKERLEENELNKLHQKHFVQRKTKSKL